jgi:hypothetical protein
MTVSVPTEVHFQIANSIVILSTFQQTIVEKWAIAVKVQKAEKRRYAMGRSPSAWTF